MTPYALTALDFRLAATVMSYKTSLKAKRKAAVKTLWLTLGVIPDRTISSAVKHE